MSITFHGNEPSYFPFHVRRVSKKSASIPSSDDVEKNKSKLYVDNAISETSLSLMNKLPRYLQPYAQLARADKPIGTMLLLWPCYWSTAIAAAPLLTSKMTHEIQSEIEISTIFGDPKLLFLFATGAFIMRGAGCTINDMWDAKFDRKVKRTVTRPLASGTLNMYQAGGFLGLQLGAGLGVLTSLPNVHYCFWLGAASLPLVGLYPLMKRFTNWPQLVLGMTFNWGSFMGWAATHGSLDALNGLSIVLPLYVGGVSWTLVYDTLYAHQDKKDDAQLGLKSTALYFGEKSKPILLGFSTLSTISWMLAGKNAGYVDPYYYVGIGTAGAHLYWQVVTADLNDAKNLAERFKSNNTVGAIVFASCVAGNIGALQ